MPVSRRTTPSRSRPFATEVATCSNPFSFSLRPSSLIILSLIAARSWEAALPRIGQQQVGARIGRDLRRAGEREAFARCERAAVHQTVARHRDQPCGDAVWAPDRPRAPGHPFHHALLTFSEAFAIFVTPSRGPANHALG